MDTGGIAGDQVGNGSTEAVDPRIAEIAAAAEKFSPVAETLAGDLQDAVLGRLRRLPKPWAQMDALEQGNHAYAIKDFCHDLVRKAVAVIAAEDRISVAVTLDTIAFKPKGIEAKLAVGAIDSATRHALVDAHGSVILLVVADAARYFGERRPVDPDQPELPLGPSPAAEQKVETELGTIIAGDDSPPVAGQISNLTAEREAAERDPYQAGKEAALHGFTESRNPFNLGTHPSSEWMSGFAAGEAERAAATGAAASGKRRRRRGNGPTATA